MGLLKDVRDSILGPVEWPCPESEARAAVIRAAREWAKSNENGVFLADQELWAAVRRLDELEGRE